MFQAATSDLPFFRQLHLVAPVLSLRSPSVRTPEENGQFPVSFGNLRVTEHDRSVRVGRPEVGVICVNISFICLKAGITEKPDLISWNIKSAAGC